MIFSHKDEVYRIWFKYILLPDLRRETTCIINRGESREKEETYSVGNAQCVPQDKFVYETGRKMALERALHGENRNFRCKAWECYHRRTAKTSPGCHI